MAARRIFAVLYACSGAAGLIYEIVWTRLLSLQLGHTVAAVGTVLAAFMVGLAGGAIIGGRIAAGRPRPLALRMYSAVEVAIAGCAAAMPLALRALVPLFAAAYGDEPGLRFAIFRIAACLLLVSIPAAAIGATFPLAIRWFVGDHAEAAGRDGGALYAVNTIGAAVGALLAGFVLIPWLGLFGTTLAGVALNAIAACGAWLLPAETPAANPPPRPAKKAPRQRRSANRSRVDTTVPAPRWLPGVVLGIAGFVALVYEVAFTRVLALDLGPTTYAFAAMLTAFIGGTAVGAVLASRFLAATKAAALSMGVMMLAVAAAGTGAGWVAGRTLPLLIAEVVADPAAGPASILAREALYGVALLLPLGMATGALFPPAVAGAARHDNRVVSEVSLAYAVNTAGAVAGSLAAAFLLVPSIGLQQTIRMAGLLALGAAVLAFVAGRLAARQRAAGIAGALTVGALVVLAPSWDVNLMSSGSYKYSTEVRDLGLDPALGLTAGSILYYNEGTAATVSVRRLAGTRALAIDGKVDASNGTDMLTQKLLGHLPLLLHPRPRRVAIIGLGSGVTAGAALAHGIERADVIELSPEVVEASTFFDDDNGRPLRDPRLNLLVTDGRTHLQLTSRQYDVIISEPSNPWMAGVAALFTREFFRAARARLAPGGIICQWAHTYDILDADLRSIAATFASEFPNGTMWLVGDSDLLLIATNDGASPAFENVASGWHRPGVAEDLASTSVFDPFSVYSLYVGGAAELQRYGQGTGIQTDGRTTLEYSAPFGMYGSRGIDNAVTLRTLLDRAQAPVLIGAQLSAAGAREWSNRGRMLLQAHAYSPAFDSFSQSLRLDPGEAALSGLVEAAGSSGRLMEAQHLLESLTPASRGATDVRIALARLLAAMGSSEQAEALAEHVIREEPDNPKGLELLASILADAGDLARLRPVVARMLERHGGREDTLYYAAIVSFLTGNFPEAITRAEQVVAMNRRHALALNLIGSANANAGRRERAREAFRAALDAGPQEPSTYANLGQLELESGNRDAAVGYFLEALTLDPHHEAARTALSTALASTRGSTP